MVSGHSICLWWRLADRFDYTVTSARLRLADWLGDLYPTTADDGQIEADQGGLNPVRCDAECLRSLPSLSQISAED
jgi:hypothetical protein